MFSEAAQCMKQTEKHKNSVKQARARALRPLPPFANIKFQSTTAQTKTQTAPNQNRISKTALTLLTSGRRRRRCGLRRESRERLELEWRQLLVRVLKTEE
ncbi:hypothetical protein AKJ16_DCAP23294 [Drosera capensis]